MKWPETTSRYFEELEKPMDYQMSHSRVDSLINRILTGTTVKSLEYCQWDNDSTYIKIMNALNKNTFESEINDLCIAAREILLKEPTLLELKAPIKIAGNFHSQLKLLMSAFERHGLPPQSNYLFFVNCGDKYVASSFETALLLLAFKLKYPDNIFLLRGNHNVIKRSRIYVDEVDEDDEDEPLLIEETVIQDCLKYLPVAALINNKIVCTHGDLSLAGLHHLDQISDINKPIRMPVSGLLCHLLDRTMRCYDDKAFGFEEMQKFLVKHDLCLICRDDDQMALRKGKASSSQKIATICSASIQSDHWMIKFNDFGAMMSVNANLKCSVRIRKPEGQGYVDYTFMAAKPATKYRSIFTGFKLTNWTSKANSGNSASASEPGSSQGVDHSVIKSATNPRSASPDLVKRAERVTFVSGTPTTARTNKYRSDSPELKIVRNHGSVRGAEPESKPRTFPLGFDPANMYRSKSPGVKRAERVTFVSGTPSTARTAKYRSDSPELKNVRNQGSVRRAEPESEPRTFPPDFDPANMYRSKSPGVKRFIGAKV